MKLSGTKKRSSGRHAKKRNSPSAAFAIPFFTALALMTVLAFAIPLRPNQSYSEKRELAQFPEFSSEALLSGTYFDDISLWFSDTFPGREEWLSLSARLEGFHGLSDVTIYGDMPEADEIPVVKAESTPAPIATPEPVPTAKPEPTPVVTPEPEIIEAPPEEPVEEWGGVNAGEDADIVFGNVLQIGDSAFAYFGFSQAGSDRYIGIMNDCADILEEKGAELYSVLAPTSVGIMVSPEYMEKIKCSSQSAVIDYMHSGMSDKIHKVNVFDALIDHNGEYIYFRTDHHWTALGAYYAYDALCETQGVESAALESFEVLDQGTYKGSFYYSCNQNSKLRLDNVYAYDPPGDITMKITAAEGNTFPWPVLTDMSRSSEGSKYMTFLAGDNPLTVITNNDLEGGKVCAVVKDSFGNPFVPFLSQNYYKVYAIDYRSYGRMQLSAFVENYEVDDVIFVESLAMSMGDGTLDLLSRLCR